MQPSSCKAARSRARDLLTPLVARARRSSKAHVRVPEDFVQSKVTCKRRVANVHLSSPTADLLGPLSHGCEQDRAARAARVTFPRTSLFVKVCDCAEAQSVSPRVLGPVLWVVPNLGTILQE